MRAHPRVESVVDTYLEAVDDEAPGLLEGLYLTGSAALGEFHPHTSDIDFVAVIRDLPDAPTVAALERAHGRLSRRHRRPFFDGRYVGWADLARDPRRAAPGPYSQAGRFHPLGRDDCDPVTWHTLAAHGIACRGPRPRDIAIWTNQAALSAWVLGNFDTYWRPLLRRARRPTDRWSMTAYTSYGAAWIVLGICRLYYTLATGRIASKEAAGRYGLAALPGHWHRVIQEALRIRAADRARPDVTSAISELARDLRVPFAAGSSLYESPIARRNDVLAFAEAVIVESTENFGLVHA
jgi:hypothetical protein